MSQREPSGPQAEALREALRRREQQRSQEGAISRAQPTAGPPDLADVFGRLFGSLLGKSARGKRRSATVSRAGSDRYEAPQQRSERYDAPSEGSDRYHGSSSSWSDRLQDRLDATKARLLKLKAERERDAVAEGEDAQWLIQSAYGVEAPDEPAELRSGTMRASALRTSAFAVEAQPSSDSPPAARRTAAAQGGRNARLRRRLGDRSEIRELYVASVLLGPPLARRQRRQPNVPKT